MNDCVIFQLYHNLSKRSMTFDIEFSSKYSTGDWRNLVIRPLALLL